MLGCARPVTVSEKGEPLPTPPRWLVILDAGHGGFDAGASGMGTGVKESELVDYAKIAKRERNVMLGPAAAVCFAGFYQALAEGKIKDGETVLINTGEGAARAKDFAAAVEKA